jgi:DNA modification methylase
VLGRADVTVRILHGDCRETLRTLPDCSVQTCVTSPPYFGLRDYGCDGQIGLESTPESFVTELVAEHREVRRVLRDDGTLWLNLGDSYAGNGAAYDDSSSTLQGGKQSTRMGAARAPKSGIGLKPKDLIGIPWRVAFALQADGWYLRQDIIWSKPNPMPESVRDRCTKAHEYLFLLSKSQRYYFDADAIAEPLAASSIERLSQPTLEQQAGSCRVPGKTNGAMKAVRRADLGGRDTKGCPNEIEGATRNKRSVWEVATQPFKEAHFATFPPALIEPCILAGSREGDVVLDPFGGAGTTGLVADRFRRDAILCELNPAYAEIAHTRITGDSPLFAEVAG